MSRRSHIDRRALFTSGAAAALLAASGVSAAGLPKQGGRLRMALSGADRSDNWTMGDGLFMLVARQGLVFDTLTEVAADGTLRPELAVDWRASGDGRIWTFDLRPDVRFHDGKPFSSADAATSLAPDLDAELVPLGPHELQIRLTVPDAGLPLRLAQPEHVIRSAHAPGSGIGTGLYQVKRFEAGQRLLTARVAQHYKDGSAGWFDEVELTSIPSEMVRRQALGEYLVDAADLHDARGLAGFPDIVLLPDARDPVQAVSTDLAQPAQISNLRPLDNLRAAERWWFG
ncbi:peptide ABC transporter substrate-binding protein [Sulfitobacter mediterraneus]|uniref:ABC transporter substrate-binding protein n=1 Tax=Sulfitobacter mediterraneus TaxID=83219 RepID=UPI001933E701|nr:ABC transporter substrate-binding protein [Sulfitobacter mediterraneus]MBM1308579.1 peptide ABC transporter substrate-binding protein [Sulfitobacter mediterraneus]MBM1312464.1 peptide ABC transporter substrate-binding protein [Sulfitobacter mediterraneus]MBM1320845.1 peptide ABC transporter substrate-binding protein [Sulfitobacter mediterraneus]MBM1324733.1 peptide ABC transporter substrate-binding protein [Sulfitobacter mediterraneus]MBM1396079.1 peptide ABC transporter substrate-binding p